jgi:small-conductance mechanosensitive channel
VRNIAPTVIAIWIARGVGAFTATALAFLLLTRLGAWMQTLEASAQARVEKRGVGIAFRKVEVLSVEALARSVSATVGAIRVVVSLSTIYIWLLIVAWLLDASHRVLDLAVRPVTHAAQAIGDALSAFIPGLAVIVVVVFIARFASRTLALFADAAREGRLRGPGFDRDLATPTQRLLTLAVWALAGIILVPYLPGGDSHGLLVLGIMFAAMLALGAVGATSNAIAGLILTYARAFRVGDRIRIGEVEGQVVGLGAFVTRVRDAKGAEVFVPNADAQRHPVANLGRAASTHVVLDCTIPWRRVHEALTLAATSLPAVASEPAPRVSHHALVDGRVRYDLTAQIATDAPFLEVESALFGAVQDTLIREGIWVSGIPKNAT